MASIYEHVTAEIIKALESGVAPWIRPWSNDGKASSPWGLPYNCAKGNEYRGANILVLWSRAKQHDYPSHAWLTLRQANELGGKVRKGESATWVHFWHWREDDKKPGKRIPSLRAYRVFNVAQCEGLPERVAVRTPFQELSQGAIEDRVRSLGVKVRLGGNKAYYQPGEDRIAVPLPGQFKDVKNFYATLLHECSHATGHRSRLARNLTGHFGDQSYAAEELIAEMGAAFSMARFGQSLDGLQHPDYLASWLKVLRSDSRAIMRAASAAQKACDWIFGTRPDDGDAETVESDAGEIAAPVVAPVGDAYPVPCADPAPVVADDETKALAAHYACDAVSKLYWSGHADSLDRDMALRVAKITGQPNREVAGVLCQFARSLYLDGTLATLIDTSKARKAAKPAKVRKVRPKATPSGWQRHPVTGFAVRVPEGKDVRDCIPFGREPERLALVAKHWKIHGRIGAANVLAMLESNGEDQSQYRHGLMSRRREAGPLRYSYGPQRIDPSVILETNQGLGRVRFRDESASHVASL